MRCRHIQVEGASGTSFFETTEPPACAMLIVASGISGVDSLLSPLMALLKRGAFESRRPREPLLFSITLPACGRKHTRVSARGRRMRYQQTAGAPISRQKGASLTVRPMLMHLARLLAVRCGAVRGVIRCEGLACSMSEVASPHMGCAMSGPA